MVDEVSRLREDVHDLQTRMVVQETATARQGSKIDHIAEDVAKILDAVAYSSGFRKGTLVFLALGISAVSAGGAIVALLAFLGS